MLKNQHLAVCLRGVRYSTKHTLKGNNSERIKRGDGRILTGRQAQDLGLVDAMGNYYDALNYAASSGGLDVDHIETRSYTNSAVTLRSLLRGEAARLSNVMGESMAGSMKKALTEGENPTIK